MRINKTKFLSYLIVFVIGIICGKLFFDKNCPEIIANDPVITVTEIVDTTISSTAIVARAPAKIEYKSTVPTPTSHPLVSSGVRPWATEGRYYVASWDSIMDGGFEAHILFDTEDRHFTNSFVIPKRTITKEKTISINTIRDLVKNQMPQYLIGIGVKSFLKDNTINTLPFLSFAANRKLWFMVATLELKALTRMNDGALKMEPELEGKIYVPL